MGPRFLCKKSDGLGRGSFPAGLGAPRPSQSEEGGAGRGPPLPSHRRLPVVRSLACLSRVPVSRLPFGVLSALGTNAGSYCRGSSVVAGLKLASAPLTLPRIVLGARGDQQRLRTRAVCLFRGSVRQRSVD